MFTLVSTHPGVSQQDVRAATGFDYQQADSVPSTPELPRDVRKILIGKVAAQIAETYPSFAHEHWPAH